MVELTEEQKLKYRKAWRDRMDRDRRQREARREKAFEKAKEAAAAIKKAYKLEKVILFGSTARNNFWERSDIDLAIGGLADESEYLNIYCTIQDIVSPFEADVVLLEKTSAKVRARILLEGIEL